MQLSNSRTVRSAIASLFATLLLNGCGGDGGGGLQLSPIPINQAPSVAVLEPSSNPRTLDIAKEKSIPVTIKVDDPDGDKLDCTWTWTAGSVSPAESVIDAGSQMTVQFTPPNYDGACTLTVSVTDGEASATTSVIITVVGSTVNAGAQLRILNLNMLPDPVAPSENSTISATVDNPGGRPLTFTWKCKYGAFSGMGNIVNWTAPGTPGTYGMYLLVSDGAESASASRLVDVAGPTGGLLGEYFSTHRDRNTVVFDDMAFSRIDPNVNFSWEKLSPAPGQLPSDGFGARWTGFFKGEEPGAYVFRVHADDAARMRVMDDSGRWIDVIPNNSENWNDHTDGVYLPETPMAVQLQGGKWYPIELEYFEGASDAFIRLYWSINGGPEEIVPQTCFRPQ